MSMPDIKAATITHMLAVSAISAQTTRIGSVHRTVWGAEPGKFILIRIAGNTDETNWYEFGYQKTRMDMEFYGATPEDAFELWRTVHPELCPRQGSGQFRFVSENCKVVGLEKESGPFELIDDVTELPFVSATYVALWSEIADT